MSEHTMYVCSDDHGDGGWTCQFCVGGLSACSVCGAFEGMWPDECPRVQMTAKTGDDVYAGKLNYREGAWRVGECCQAMRHIHDLDNFMAEAGYRRDAEGRWQKN